MPGHQKCSCMSDVDCDEPPLGDSHQGRRSNAPEELRIGTRSHWLVPAKSCGTGGHFLSVVVPSP